MKMKFELFMVEFVFKYKIYYMKRNHSDKVINKISNFSYDKN